MASTSFIDMMNGASSVSYSVGSDTKNTSLDVYPTQAAAYAIPSSTAIATLYSELNYMPLDATSPIVMLKQPSYKQGHVSMMNNTAAATAPVVVKSQGNGYYHPVSTATAVAHPSPPGFPYMMSGHLQSPAALSYAPPFSPTLMTPTTPSSFPMVLPFTNAIMMGSRANHDYPNSTMTVMAPSSVLSQQPPAAQTQRPLPRRHTVSNPNKHVETPNAKLRKALRDKRHRSLDKLDDTAFDKWVPPPDDAISSPSCCSPILGSHVLVDAKDAMSLVGSYHSDMADDKAGDGESMMDDKKPQRCMWTDCYQELQTLEALVTHVTELHIGSGKPLYYCAWKGCPRQQKSFSKRHKMHNHLRTHTGERPFECTEPGCGKRFSRPDSLTTHSKIHSNIHPYACPYLECGRAYYHLRSLRKHERMHGESSSFSPRQEGRTKHAEVSLGDNTITLQNWCGTLTSGESV